MKTAGRNAVAVFCVQKHKRMWLHGQIAGQFPNTHRFLYLIQSKGTGRNGRENGLKSGLTAAQGVTMNFWAAA